MKSKVSKLLKSEEELDVQEEPEEEKPKFNFK